MQTLPIAWQDQAACMDETDVDFFPPRGKPALEARAICLSCPVRWECLEWALPRERIGVWGGTTELQRRRLRKLVPPHVDTGTFADVMLRVQTEDVRLRNRLELGYGPLPAL